MALNKYNNEEPKSKILLLKYIAGLSYQKDRDTYEFNGAEYRMRKVSQIDNTKDMYYFVNVTNLTEIKTCDIESSTGKPIYDGFNNISLISQKAQNIDLLIRFIPDLTYQHESELFEHNSINYRLQKIKKVNGNTNSYEFMDISNPKHIIICLVNCHNGRPLTDGFNGGNVIFTHEDRQKLKQEYHYKYYHTVKKENYNATDYIKICPICQNSFRAEYGQKYCSDSCRKEAIKKKSKKNNIVFNKICEVCGKEFETRYKNKKYCSTECLRKHNYKVIAQKQKESRYSEKICQFCGKKFIGTAKNYYCSKQCRNKSSEQKKKQKRILEGNNHE